MMDKTIGLHVDWINEAHLSISMEKILQNNKKEKSEPINLTKFDNIEIEKIYLVLLRFQDCIFLDH